MRQLMSPRRWVPLSRMRSRPPSSCSTRPAFTRLCPWMLGAREWARRRRMSGCAATSSMFSMSLAVSLECPAVKVAVSQLLGTDGPGCPCCYTARPAGLLVQHACRLPALPRIAVSTWPHISQGPEG